MFLQHVDFSADTRILTQMLQEALREVEGVIRLSCAYLPTVHDSNESYPREKGKHSTLRAKGQTDMSMSKKMLKGL